jgi:hypothetical protein
MVDTPLREINRETLTRNLVYAVFKGIEERPSMVMMIPPPPPKTFAYFEIREYIEYEKPGKYGDNRQSSQAFELLRQSADVQSFAQQLQPGDIVKLGWTHDYVTRSADGGVTASKSPDRRVFLLERARNTVLTLREVGMDVGSALCLHSLAGEEVGRFPLDSSTTLAIIRNKTAEKLQTPSFLLELLLGDKLLKGDATILQDILADQR